ncbi:uncharacterized protein LOC132613199 [Lycium barbarum]|uniref:uncharacterized protein LOC132613199 n=1 Tax=Lycium barbarum TaxID=112863 RepID=UPI00293F76DB|nr:uncharacterized protein LOC132613199 [Lycium barbarum]
MHFSYSEQLAHKIEGSRSFTIEISIGTQDVARALCDLGASINLMPSSIFRKLGLGVPRPTTIVLQLADRSLVRPEGIIEDVLVQVGSLIIPADFVILDFEPDPEVPFILGHPFLATGRALIDVAAGELTMRVHDKVEVFNVYQALKMPAIYEELSAITVLNDDTRRPLIASHDPLKRALVRDDIFCDMETFEMVQSLDMVSIYIRAGEFEHLDRTMGVTPKLSIEEPPKLELKPLPAHFKYAFLGEGDTFPVILAAELTTEEVNICLKVLKSHKRASGWQISDIQGISPALSMHKILMEDDHKPSAQHQRRLNPVMKEVVKKEVIKWLDSGIIFPISDSKWVSPMQCVPKKGGMTVVTNDKNDHSYYNITGWRICMDYRTLNETTRKDHYPIPFIDQMLDRLAGQEFYYFLDGYSGYNQIAIAPEDQEKTAFTCSYGTYAFKRMPFGLCNAPATFQRCMMAIFSEMVEDFVQVFMDDFSVFGNSFKVCLQNLDRVLARCEETNLVLNWEKCHFMVRERIVLRHKVSKRGMKVDRAKMEVIEKLPPPISVKGVRSFLGHAGFYRRFIKDFSKISSPMCRLLEKDVKFLFDDACIKAFEGLQTRLVTAPIIIAPDWNFPFELMCDASDNAVGAVLGQQREKVFHSINYASKILDAAQLNYTVTEKELLAVVYAFDKFRSYLVGTHVIVYTDHAAIRYLFSKKDAKPRLIRWILLLQEFDIEIKDRKGAENQLFAIPVAEVPWYADIVNLIVSGVYPPEATSQQRKKLYHDSRFYIWDESYLFKQGTDQLVRRCIPQTEVGQVLESCHSSPYGGHFQGDRTTAKVLQSGFYWPTLFKDAHAFARSCD